MNHFQDPAPLEVARDQTHLFAEHFKVIMIFDLPGILLDDEMAPLITSSNLFSVTLLTPLDQKLGVEVEQKPPCLNSLSMIPAISFGYLMSSVDFLKFLA